MATIKKAEPAPAFDFDLVVVHQVGFDERGARITDPVRIAEIIASDGLHNCHKVPKQDAQ